MSKLHVEIDEILSIESHPNADRLDIATVKGWKVICGKSEFKPGDKVIYIPVDSLLPPDLEEKLFANTKVKLHNHRIRAAKIRGFISQGLLVQLSVAGLNQDLKIGTDVADKLGITKYEPPENPQKQGQPRAKRHCNSLFFKYTDIDRIENFPKVFDGVSVQITEKTHGSSFRAGILPYEASSWFKKVLQFLRLSPKFEFVFGSHNVQLHDKSPKHQTYYKENIYLKTCKQYDIQSKLKPHEVVYGEIYGDGIQKNYNYGLKNETKLVVFDVMVNSVYLDPADAIKFCQERGLPHVPVLYTGPYSDKVVDDLKGGASVLCPDQKVREGIVIKAQKESRNNWIGRLVAKKINPEYLIKDNTDWH